MTPIQAFFYDQSAILHRLWQSFPRPCSLWVVDFVGQLELDEYGLQADRHLRCLACMQWLAAEGWIRFHDIERELGVNQAVLSQQALQALLKPVGEISLIQAISQQLAEPVSQQSLGELQNLCMQMMQN